MRYKKPQTESDGWCDWQFPRMEAYKMACCDCGLVHDMQFAIAQVKSIDGIEIFERRFTGTKTPKSGRRVAFRVKRNARATAAMRRKRK